MAEGVDINWSLARPAQNYSDSYANAFQLGRQFAGRNIQNDAPTTYAAAHAQPQTSVSPPATEPNARPPSVATPALAAVARSIDPRLAAVNPALYRQLVGRQPDNQIPLTRGAQAGATAASDPPGAVPTVASRAAEADVSAIKAQIDAAPEAGRNAAITTAQQKNEAYFHVLRALQQYPPEQRLGIAQHIAGASGLLNPATITADDVTDSGIDAHIASIMTVDQMLLHEQAARTARHNTVDSPLGSHLDVRTSRHSPRIDGGFMPPKVSTARMQPATPPGGGQVHYVGPMR
jgi:hypothetical protein